MKKYILLAAATISLAACNNDDNYLDEPVAARISATIGCTAVSRASDAAWANGDAFGVTMIGRYSNMKYTTTVADDGKASFSGETLYFENKRDKKSLIAYYPFDGNEGEAPAVIEVSTDAGHQVAQPTIDFLYAAVENVSGASPDVKFEFSHMMSKLTLIFVNGNPGTDVSKISSYTIEGLTLDGTFNPADGACAAKDGATAEPLAITLSEGTVKNGEAIPSLILFPQNVEKVTLKIHDSDNQDYSCELKFDDNKLLSGNNYQFTINVNKTKLSVDTSIADWTPKNMTPDKPIDADSED